MVRVISPSWPLRLLFSLALAAAVLVARPVSAQEEEPEESAPADTAAVEPEVSDYAKLITDEAVTDSGLFDVHRIEDTIYFEIPNELLGRDMLLVSRIARVPAEMANGFMAAGHKTGEQVVRWERQGDRILLRKYSYQAVAKSDEPIYRSVVNNHFAPIVAAFSVEAEGPEPPEGDDEDFEPSTVVINVSDFYVKDVPATSGLSRSIRESYKVSGLDKDRSFLNFAHSYPRNVDVRSTLTFKAKEPPSDANTQTLSLEMHQSMILLPEEPMRPRFADSRVGWFTVEQVNYSLDNQKADTQSFLARWRLEPKDPRAYARGKLVEPKKPIVWYIDPATPKKWKPWVKKGVEDWQKAFETAGFKKAVLAKDPPTPEEDPEWNGEDVRYSMVRWAATRMRNAMGPSVSDPRSGEIIESDIVWYHNHMRSYRNRLLLETGAANPQARSLPIDDDLMGEAIRQVIAHEIGHALGLPHNMIASSAYPVEKLRDPKFAGKMGVAPTIMDYARQNYIAQPGDGLKGADFIRQIGPYDHYAVNWGYRVIPDAKTPEDEKPILDRWILEKAGDPIYRYSPQRGGWPIDPRIQTEDLGDDPVLASGYGIANLKRVAPRLVEWTSTPGEDYRDLAELFGEMLWQYQRYLRHVISVVGGVHETLKATDQEGLVYEPVDAGWQRRAMEFLAREAFSTPEWLLDPEILGRIEHAGAVDRVRRIQSSTLNVLLEPGRLQRLIEAEAAIGDRAYPALEFMDDLKSTIWGDLGSIDPYRRNLQRAHLERLEYLMTEDPGPSPSPWVWQTPVDVSLSDIRALARGQLREVQDEAERGAGRAADTMTRMHLEDVAARIDAILDPHRGE